MAKLIDYKSPESDKDETPYTEVYEIEHKTCDHKFEYETAQSIRCGNCHAGYTIGQGDYIKDGHLYHKDQKIV